MENMKRIFVRLNDLPGSRDEDDEGLQAGVCKAALDQFSGPIYLVKIILDECIVDGLIVKLIVIG